MFIMFLYLLSFILHVFIMFLKRKISFSAFFFCLFVCLFVFCLKYFEDITPNVEGFDYFRTGPHILYIYKVECTEEVLKILHNLHYKCKGSIKQSIMSLQIYFGFIISTTKTKVFSVCEYCHLVWIV